ncbi:PilZ domain-containing protein [Paenibacillus sp. M1]|uniref:PilZ domain-containing protein n=1 Tax=Paenibacillus haidiansis TaxID=1574488 RepID=A0ABU7VW39_9BACL
MPTKRKDPFRYTLKQPLSCRIEIKTIDQKPVSSKPAEAELIDISKSGCRIRTNLNLQAENYRIEAAVHVQLNENMLVFPGEILWQQQLADSFFHYGMQLELNAEEKENLNAELRLLAGAQRIIVM